MEPDEIDDEQYVDYYSHGISASWATFGIIFYGIVGLVCGIAYLFKG